MKKPGRIFLGIFTGIIVILALIYIYTTQSPTVKAYLNVESGDVLVDVGRGFVAAEDNMKLKEDYVIKTGENGEASIVLYESVVITLDPNTEIRVGDLDKDNIQIKQNSGSTWTKFMNILGVSGMSIETPNTVATVRGTNFGVDMFSVYVDEGVVKVRAAGKEEEIAAGESAMYDNGSLTKGMLTEEQKQRIIRFKKRQLVILEDIRVKEIEKKKMIVERLLKANNLRYEDLPKYLKDIDNGEGDLNEIAENIPIKIETAEKVIKITEKIREERRRIAELENLA